MTAKEIIARFGSVRSLADAIKHEPALVWRWQKRGIPVRVFQAIADEAKRREIHDVTLEVLVAHRADRDRAQVAA